MVIKMFRAKNPFSCHEPVPPGFLFKALKPHPNLHQTFLRNVMYFISVRVK